MSFHLIASLCRIVCPLDAMPAGLSIVDRPDLLVSSWVEHQIGFMMIEPVQDLRVRFNTCESENHRLPS